MDVQRDNRSVDEAIAGIANRQGGVVSRKQLLALGVDRGALEKRTKIGRLRVIHRGVYAVGHDAIPVRGLLCAALLVAGADAALSHRTAAALHKLLPSMPVLVDVSVTGRCRTSRRPGREGKPARRSTKPSSTASSRR